MSHAFPSKDLVPLGALDRLELPSAESPRRVRPAVCLLLAGALVLAALDPAGYSTRSRDAVRANRSKTIPAEPAVTSVRPPSAGKHTHRPARVQRPHRPRRRATATGRRGATPTPKPVSAPQRSVTPPVAARPTATPAAGFIGEFF